MKHFIFASIGLCILVGVWFLWSEMYSAQAQHVSQITFSVERGMSVSELSKSLEDQHVIRNSRLFTWYLRIKGIDKEISFGTYTVDAPITLARVVHALSEPSVNEKVITIIPGWSLRDIAVYLEDQGIGSQNDFFVMVGTPAHSNTNHVFKSDAQVLKSKPNSVSLEGYLRPDTYRIFEDATLEDVVEKLVRARDIQFTQKMYDDIQKSGRTVHEVMTVASIVEREVRTEKDKEIVADIFWRRYDINWALQADSTVHYVVNKSGNVFTTKEDRDSLNPYNTYRYPGLPPGPISMPSLETIMATIYPSKNENWYFLTDASGKVYYAETLEGHNENRQKYL